MIRSFRHRGLELLYYKGSTRGVRHDHVPRLRRILFLLDHASTPADLRIPSYRTHRLSGNLEGHWSMVVTSNWRVVFRFSSQDIVDVDYLDYH